MVHPCPHPSRSSRETKFFWIHLSSKLEKPSEIDPIAEEGPCGLLVREKSWKPEQARILQHSWAADSLSNLGLCRLTSWGLLSIQLENLVRCEAGLKIICGMPDLLDHRVQCETAGPHWVTALWAVIGKVKPHRHKTPGWWEYPVQEREASAESIDDYFQFLSPLSLSQSLYFPVKWILAVSRSPAHRHRVTVLSRAGTLQRPVCSFHQGSAESAGT